MAAQREVHDHYFREAKREGYLARSAYKLTEIQEKKKVIARGDRVLDLGCAPGAWLQVACRALGPIDAGGSVVGLDIKPTAKPGRYCDGRVSTIEGDVFEVSADTLRAPIDDQMYDVVLSDMMGSTRGHKDADHFQSLHLARRALELSMSVLRFDGHLVAKIFEGAEYAAFVDECRAVFTKVKGYRPKASRKISREMFVIAMHKKKIDS